MCAEINIRLGKDRSNSTYLIKAYLIKMLADRQAGRQTGSQAGRHANMHTGKHGWRQCSIVADMSAPAPTNATINFCFITCFVIKLGE